MKRPHMSLGVKLCACLIRLGFHPLVAAKAAGVRLPPDWLGRDDNPQPGDAIQWDHDPALELRPYALNLYMPDANDPRYIVPRTKAEHAIKTDGVPHIPLSGDKAKIAKVKRLAAMMKRELPKEVERLQRGLKKPKRAWPKRKFPTRVKRGV